MQNEDTMHRVALMALVNLAFYGSIAWFYLFPMTAMVAVGLLWRGAFVRWEFWVVVTALVGFSLVQLWYEEGNHLYLLFYLSLAIMVSLSFEHPEDAFRRNARLMIATVFLLATFWKLVTPSFRSGDFFEYYLVHDRRLAPVAVAFTDLKFDDVLSNRERLSRLPDEEVVLASTPRVRVMARVLTVVAISLEGLVALAFALPVRGWGRARDSVLLTFLATAYVVIPVPAFGMSLACLGFGQSTWRLARRAYLVLFVIMPLTAIRYYLTPL